MSLFKLPRELRDQIYIHYFVTENGYRHFDTATNKLRLHSQCNRLEETTSLIDLSLLYVCKAITLEARDVPLSVNPISFTTASLHDRQSSELAKRFERAINERNDIRAWLLNRCRSCIDKEIYDESTRAFPGCVMVLDYLIQEPPVDRKILQSAQDWGHIPSTHHDIIDHLIQRIFSQPGFRDLAQQALIDWNADLSPPLSFMQNIVFSRTRLSSWNIPAMQDLISLERDVGIVASNEAGRPVPTARTLSAASLCIRLLRSLPERQRKSIRHLNLYEGRMSAALSPSHVLGFLPLWKENPKLRIER